MNHILIVEDDPLLCQLISAFLNDLEAKITIAHSANEALEALKNNVNINLITVDNGLPDSTGCELILEIRKLKETAKILLLTGNCTKEIQNKAIENGADLCMEKDLSGNFLENVMLLLK